MAKWFGKIGFEGQTVETAPSVFTEETVEREYYGDVLEWGRQLQAGDGVNDNVTFQNRLSIVADPFAHENFGSIYETVVPGSAAGYTGLVFRIPAEAPVKTLCTADLDLVPTGPLFVEPNEEAVRTLIAAPWHGAIEYSPLKDRVFKNAEGSWEFYYVLDEKAHSCWDCYIDPPINREDRGYAVTERTWTSTYHTLLHFLQGKRVLVDVPDGKGSIKTYKGRCWVSGYTTDESGQIKATIAYSLAPP